MSPWGCTKAEGDILQAQSATARWHRAEEGPCPKPSPTDHPGWTCRKPLLSQNQPKNLCLLPTSSGRANNAPAFSVPFPYWTNPLPELVQTFLVAPILGAELHTSVTVTPLSEAVQSPQTEASSCRELSFKIKINNTILPALSPDLAALRFPLPDHSAFVLPPHHPQLGQRIPRHCPRKTNSTSREGVGGSCGQTASTVPSHSL